MKNRISLIDPKLLSEGTEDPRYANSIFRNLKFLPPRSKGDRYEELTEIILRRMGKSVLPSPTTDYDRVVGGKRIEIKGSMLNKGIDKFSFLQIRPDQEYDFIYFSMFYPEEVYIMSMDKETILKNIDKNVFKKQHGGQKASSGTYSYYGNKETLARIGAVEVV